MNQLKEALDQLSELLASFDEGASKYVRGLKNKSPQIIADDLALLGGSGSVMDQAVYGQSREVQQTFEECAVKLGKTLLEAGFSKATHGELDISL